MRPRPDLQRGEPSPALHATASPKCAPPLRATTFLLFGGTAPQPPTPAARHRVAPEEHARPHARPKGIGRCRSRRTNLRGAVESHSGPSYLPEADPSDSDGADDSYAVRLSCINFSVDSSESDNHAVGLNTTTANMSQLALDHDLSVVHRTGPPHADCSANALYRGSAGASAFFSRASCMRSRSSRIRMSTPTTTRAHRSTRPT